METIEEKSKKKKNKKLRKWHSKFMRRHGPVMGDVKMGKNLLKDVKNILDEAAGAANGNSAEREKNSGDLDLIRARITDKCLEFLNKEAVASKSIVRFIKIEGGAIEPYTVYDPADKFINKTAYIPETGQALTYVNIDAIRAALKTEFPDLQLQVYGSSACCMIQLDPTWLMNKTAIKKYA